MARLNKRQIGAKKAWEKRRAKADLQQFAKVQEKISTYHDIGAASLKSLYDELQEAITNLENAMQATTKRINSIMKV